MRMRWARRRAAGAGLALLIGLTLAACGRGESAADAGKAAEADPGTQTAAPEFASPALAAIKRRGRLNCGVHEGLVGFAYIDNRGEWRGFDADFCRALAAAVLGDAGAVRFVPLTGSQRFEALRSGRVDVLWRSTSWTLTREAREGIRFAGVNYYDGQGFLVRRSLDLASAAELNGARVCVQRATTSELNVADWFRARGLEYTPVLGANEEAARAAYGREDCDALTADISALAAARTTLSNPEQHALLPDVISKEPLGPAVRRGDEAWTSIVRWTLNALILAEELGVTSGNADRLARESSNPQIRRLLGVEGDIGPLLGLRKDWAKSAIEAEGNYGEIFSRNVGTDSPLDLARGLNAQWNATPGGLIYALPIR
jgi:general L-amino acid transport system substrate-binding protein